MEAVEPMYLRPLIATFLAAAGCLAGQGAPASEPTKPAQFIIQTGTKVPLGLINTISTKHSVVGDSVYLETVFPILANGRIVIPVGSYVVGTVTEVKRPGRIKGRGELYVRFESLTLPNGVMRDFHGRIGSLDGQTPAELDRTEGAVKSEGNKAGDMRTIGETTAGGSELGAIAGAAAGHPGLGLGMGAAAGAATGLIAVLVTRGPDAVLERGSTVEMVLDRPLEFAENELNFANSPAAPALPPADPNRKTTPTVTRRFPY
jgi:type IV secretion system protein VirB10